jgi:hypothetical protein
VEEAEIASMQFQLARARTATVKRIAHNRNSQPLGMGRVNSELMGSSGDGLKDNTGKSVFDADLLPSGNSELPMHGVVNLHRTVVDIEPEGKLKRTPLPRQFSLEKSDIPLLCLTAMELDRKIPVRSCGPRDYYQSGRIHV